MLVEEGVLFEGKTHKANVNCRSDSGHTPLHLACAKKNQKDALEIVKILTKAGAAVNALDNVGHNCLFYATESRSVSIVAYLLTQCVPLVDIYQANDLGVTAFHSACRSGQMEVMNLLLGAQPLHEFHILGCCSIP